MCSFFWLNNFHRCNNFDGIQVSHSCEFPNSTWRIFSKFHSRTTRSYVWKFLWNSRTKRLDIFKFNNYWSRFFKNPLSIISTKTWCSIFVTKNLFSILYYYNIILCFFEWEILYAIIKSINKIYLFICSNNFWFPRKINFNWLIWSYL